MQCFREKLPAFNMREGFLKAVAANQVSYFQSLFYFIVYPLNVLSGQCMLYSLSTMYLSLYTLLFSLVITCFPLIRKVIL
jgi:ATP-dependent RNA helicase DHX36